MQAQSWGLGPLNPFPCLFAGLEIPGFGSVGVATVLFGPMEADRMDVARLGFPASAFAPAPFVRATEVIRTVVQVVADGLIVGIE